MNRINTIVGAVTFLLGITLVCPAKAADSTWPSETTTNEAWGDQAMQQYRADLVAAMAALSSYGCEWQFAGKFGLLACKKAVGGKAAVQVLAAVEMVYEVDITPWHAWSDLRNVQCTFKRKPSPWPFIHSEVVLGHGTIEAPMR